jgi:hypothetical protein
MSLVSETVQIDLALAPTSIKTAKTSAYLPLVNYRNGLFVVTTSTVKSGDSVEVQLLQAKSTTGTSSKNLGTAKTVTATANGSLIVTIGAEQIDLDDADFTTIAVKITATIDDEEDDITATAVLLRGDGRYGVGVQ